MAETALSMHAARDAEDGRLLAAGGHRQLVESYWGTIVGRCKARVATQDAYDVAVAVAERLLAELARGKTYGDLPYRVVVHSVVGWTCKAHFERLSHDAPLDEATDGQGADTTLTVDDADAFQALLAPLTALEREVVVLRYLHDLDIAEIAARTDRTRNAVDQILFRALGRLRAAEVEA